MAIRNAELNSKKELTEIELRRKSEEEKFKLDRFHVEENEKILLFKADNEIERKKKEAEAGRECTKILTESEKILNDEKIRFLRDSIESNNVANEAGLQRLFIEKVLPEFSQHIADSANNMNYTVFQSDQPGGANPMSYLMMQLQSLVHNFTGSAANQTNKPKPN